MDTLPAVLIFIFPLTWCAVLDLTYGVIPDVNHILVLFGGIMLAQMMPQRLCLISLAAAGLLLAAACVAVRLKKHWLGGADVKLMALIIICAGAVSAISVFLAAFALAGLVSVAVKAVNFFRKKVLKDKSRPLLSRYGGGIPFAPFLLAGVCLYYSF